MTQLDEKGLLSAGYTKDVNDNWTRGITIGNDTLGVEAYGGGAISGQTTHILTAMDQAALQREINLTVSQAKYPWPSSPREIRDFHFQEMALAIKEHQNDKATALNNQAAKVNSRISTENSFLHVDKNNSASWAQSVLALQQAALAEMKANVDVSQKSIDLLQTQIYYNQGDIFWPVSDQKVAEAQGWIDKFTAEQNTHRQEINNYNQVIAQINTQISQTNNDIAQIKAGNVPAKYAPKSETQQILDATKTTSDFYKDVTTKLGQVAGNNATALANASVGKKIKSASAGLAAWNKYGQAVFNKYSAADRTAIVNALESLNQANLAQNYAGFAKAFTRTSQALDGYSWFQTIRTAVQTNNWNPVFVKTESMMAGYVAGELVALAFAGLALTPATAVLYGLVIAIVSYGLNEDNIATLNSWFPTIK